MIAKLVHIKTNLENSTRLVTLSLYCRADSRVSRSAAVAVALKQSRSSRKLSRGAEELVVLVSAQLQATATQAEPGEWESCRPARFGQKVPPRLSTARASLGLHLYA